MNSQRKFLTDSAIALTATTAFLYCVSTAHYHGYLNAFHLDADILDRNFHQTLYNGFVVSIPPAFLVLFLYTFAHFIYSHLIISEIRGVLRQSRKARKWIVGIKRFWGDPHKVSEFEKSQRLRTVSIAHYLFSFIALIASLVYFESEGKNAASSILTEVENNNIPTSSLIVVRINGKPLHLLSLVCGARNCAAIEPRSKMIYYFPQNGHAYLLDTLDGKTDGVPSNK